jgi:hypothetical protein
VQNDMQSHLEVTKAEQVSGRKEEMKEWRNEYV